MFLEQDCDPLLLTVVLNVPTEPPLTPLALPTRVPGRPGLEGPFGRVGEGYGVWTGHGEWRQRTESLAGWQRGKLGTWTRRICRGVTTWRCKLLQFSVPLLPHHKCGHRLPLWAGVMTDLSSGSPPQTVQPWAYVGYVFVVICTKNITGEETEQEEGIA